MGAVPVETSWILLGLELPQFTVGMEFSHSHELSTHCVP